MLPAKRLKPASLKPNPSIVENKAQSRNAALLDSIESFSTDLYRCIANHEKGNVVYSGLSIHLALSMCAFGARGNTAKEMQQALHLKNITPDDFKNIMAYFENVQDIELNVANGIFTDESILVKNSFKENVDEFFSSDVIDVDFANQREDAVSYINKWCSEKTNNKIPKILTEDDVDSSTKMILTNAVYLKASWLDPFDSRCTRKKPFFVENNTTINVPTMHQSYSYCMYKDLKRWNAECIAIPYRNDEYLFVIIKPKEIDGLEKLQINLHKIQLDFNNRLGQNNDFEYKAIHLALPKFKIESDINLKEYLPKLGMAEMFTRQANFKGVSEEPLLDPPLCVAGVAQKAFIEVNEKGTEAAALSYVQLKGGGGPIEWHDFKVDRPFFYRIVNKAHNFALFSGRVVEPECD